MTLVRTHTPYGYVIFCDDIRFEFGGKTTYVGVYSGTLVGIGSFPLVLPKFVMLATYIERPGESTEPVQIRAFLPGEADPFTRIDLPMNEARSAALPDDLPDPLIMVSAPIGAAPLVLAQAGWIKVRAYRGDEEIRLGALSVSMVETPPSDMFGASASSAA